MFLRVREMGKRLQRLTWQEERVLNLDSAVMTAERIATGGASKVLPESEGDI